MKKTIPKTIIFMSRNLLFGILIQTLLTSMVFAVDMANAQKLKDVYLKVDIGDVTLGKSLQIIEENTDFNFSFQTGNLPLAKKLKISGEDHSLQEILTQISKKAKVSFKRINNQIIVKSYDAKADLNVIDAAVADITISGKVTDAQTNEPIPGASILIKGTTKGTVTDFDGNYKIIAPEDGTLQISYVGFTTQEVEVGGRSTIDIALATDLNQLEEILIVGYGTSNKEDVTGAVTNVDAVKEINNRPINNVESVLQGTVAGVTVVNNSGDPTSTPTIRIRGIGTMNDEAPLYVVDGIPNAPVPNPTDIKTMTVLKDASAAAIYGVRAAAGVILIETKKGEAGKPKVSFNAYGGFQQAWKKLESLDAREYAEVMNTAFDNAGYADDYNGRDYIKEDLNPYGFVTRTDWIDEIFRSGTMQNYDLSVSGGSDKGTYMASVGHRKIEGTLLNTYSKIYSARFNSSLNLSDKLRVGENIMVKYTDGNYGVNTSSGYTGALISAIYYPRSAVVWEDQANGIYGGVVPSDNTTYAGSYGDLINPVAYLNRLDDKRPTTTLSGNFFLDYDILEGLKFRFNGGLNRTVAQQSQFTSKVPEIGKISDYNELYESTTVDQSWVAENTLTYEKLFNNVHGLKLMVGYTAQKNTSEYNSITGRGFMDESQSSRYMANASEITAFDGSKYEYALTSWLGRVNYDYNDKYFFTGIVRRDGTSKLYDATSSDNNHIGVFPSLSVGWKLSNESFIQDISAISFLKLRAGWGKIGNLGSLSNYPLSLLMEKTQALLGESGDYYSYYGYAINELASQNLKWETTEQTDIGIDAAFFNDKITLTADYFFKNTHDILARGGLLPGTAGVDYNSWTNNKQVKNKGWEISLGYNHQSQSDFQFSINANLSHVKNEVVAMGDVEYETYDNNVRYTLYPIRSQVGQPVYSFYVYETDGIFQSNDEVSAYTGPDGNLVQPYAKAGDLKFVDQNGDGELDDDDKVFKGNAFPEFTYGLNANFAYKGFDLSLFFQGVQNVNLFNGLKLSTLMPTQGYNMLSDIKDAWSPTNTGSDIPIVSVTDENNNFGTVSDWYIEDASYLRLKNLTLGYTIPSSAIEKAGMSSLRVYFTATNLLTFTDYTGFDPEVDAVTNKGIDVGQYPQSRSYILGLNVQF
ncbi:SusC/RagA family TonB-linked outer membrane protein [Chondrinema litorale]|uniref:SusC/RagA family TonB-linked outer membrane protein n=1 Tax=Chondrinema litorale TaxID=2994555 RepID=UPI002543F658|nr:TonB-dependent receptor [Chondrinema litorale]UZR97544.1 TonB-dependent receptor [Chondrinema litorale]